MTSKSAADNEDSPDSKVERIPRTLVPKRANLAGFHARAMMRSELARTDSQLLADYTKVLQGHCIYLPSFFGVNNDYHLMKGLNKDLERNSGTGMVNWSKHLKHENPEFSKCFQFIIQQMSDFFDVEVYATRLNFYADGSSWKPFHHDSHAYGGREKREDFTMGASFGCQRKLTFLHPSSGQMFDFPQQNCDIFAFTSEANKAFQHGVPKAKHGAKAGPRFSVIAWGRRRTLNERNAASEEIKRAQEQGEQILSKPPEGFQQKVYIEEEEGNHQEGSGNSTTEAKENGHIGHSQEMDERNQVVMDSQEVSDCVDKFLKLQARDESHRGARAGANPWAGRGGRGGRDSAGAGRSRVQGGWAGAGISRGRGGDSSRPTSALRGMGGRGGVLGRGGGRDASDEGMGGMSGRGGGMSMGGRGRGISVGRARGRGGGSSQH